DAFAVRHLQSRSDLYAELQHLIDFHRLAGNQMLEGAALQQFHGDEGLAFALINFINRADIGMVESGCRTSLTSKTFEALRIVSYIFREELQSDKAAQPCVFRLIHHAHSTTAKLLKNSIVSDGLAEHGLIRLSY